MKEYGLLQHDERVEITKIPSENRKCQYCNVLEDEFHFIFECPRYNNIRYIYFQDYLNNVK